MKIFIEIIIHLYAVIKSNTESSPGSDSFIKEFYQIFKDLIEKNYVNIIKKIYKKLI